MLKTHEKLILASDSAIRKKMLANLQIEFSTETSRVDEAEIKNQMKPKKNLELAIQLAEAKAKAVSASHPGVWILGADQVCHDNEQTYNKAQNRENAISQLMKLQGKTHWLISGASLVKNGQVEWSGTETAALSMRKLDRRFIESFINFEKNFNSCGSYQYESFGKILFEKVTGSYECILGLPLHQILGVFFERKILSV